MLNRVFGPKTHDNIQMFAVFVLAVGIPVSKVVMSIGTLLLALNFLLNADFKNYWERCKKNLVFWFVFIMLLLHLVGLTYTSDFSFALRDMNTKLPFFAIPIILIAYPIKERFLNYVFYGFLLSLLITSIVNINFMITNETKDYREFSLFGSHIRYALLVVTGILLSLYLLLHNKKWWIIYTLVGVWFTYYTFVSMVDSGYVAIVFLFFGSLIYYMKMGGPSALKKFVIIFTLAIVGIVGAQMYEYFSPKKSKVNFKELPTHTKSGEKYYHDTTSVWYENGHHILSNIASNELEQAWIERSDVDYNKITDSGYKLNSNLIRYMSSKGLTKDKEGMRKMSKKDIENVENGMVSVSQTYGTLGEKLAGLKNEIHHYSVNGDPDGNSLLQRFEHWKAAKTIISENWLFGVGTGDLQQSFNDAYKKSNTQLDEAHWNRAHNQFMTFWIGFGVFGFVIFTGFWLWFLWRNIKLENLIGIGFTLIAIGSFLSEDTIETQQGVTYIALFLGVVALMNSWKKEKGKE